MVNPLFYSIQVLSIAISSVPQAATNRKQTNMEQLLRPRLDLSTEAINSIANRNRAELR